MKKWIPNTLTSLNLSFGVIAIVINDPWWSVICILVAAIFDVFDGFAARKLNVVSEIGEQLDSFADLISFGFAPVFILQNQLHLDTIVQILVLISGALFAALRLARFNIMEPKPYFIGLPTPAYGMTILGLILTTTGNHTFSPLLYSLIAIIAAVLMISKLPFPAFKSYKNSNISILPLFIAGIILVSCLFIAKEAALLAAMLSYILSSILFYLFKNNL